MGEYMRKEGLVKNENGEKVGGVFVCVCVCVCVCVATLECVAISKRSHSELCSDPAVIVQRSRSDCAAIPQ
jgi:hypothetical protein